MHAYTTAAAMTSQLKLSSCFRKRDKSPDTVIVVPRGQRSAYEKLGLSRRLRVTESVNLTLELLVIRKLSRI